MRFILLAVFSWFSLYGAERALYEGSFETKSTGIFLSGEINGQECQFLFDTGASFVVLDKKFKALLGEPLSLKETQARTGIAFASDRIMTPNGEIDLELYKAFPIRLGRLQVANRFPYIIADLQALWPFSGVPFCGILGTSFLHQFRWEIDFGKGVIKAYIGAEPYMGDYRSKKPIYWSRAHIPSVEVDIGGKEVAFDIDLGDNGSGRMRRENLAWLKKQEKIVKTQMQDVITVNTRSQSEEFRLDSLTFAETVYPGLVMQESGQNALGLAFFNRHDIVLDFPFNMLYLRHHKEFAQRQELDKSGIRIVLLEGKLIVFSVKPMEGALVKDVKKDDEIVGINGVKNLSLYEARRLLRGKEGESISLLIKRGDKVINVDVVLGKDPL